MLCLNKLNPNDSSLSLCAGWEVILKALYNDS